VRVRFPVRKRPAALRQVTGRGAEPGSVRENRSRSGPPEASSLGDRMVACRIGAPVRTLRVARDEAQTSAPRRDEDGSCPSNAGRVYRHRGARWRPTMTAGTLTSSEPEWSGEVTARYKLCEIRVERGGEVDGQFRLFGALSISRLRPGPWPLRTERALGRKPDTEGSNRSGR